MTVTAQDLEDYSPFKVSEEITAPTFINSAQFEKYAALAKLKLDRDDPGLSPAEYDHAHALLIAHQIAARAGNLERKEERLDNYSYSKAAGSTSFLLQYKVLINEVYKKVQDDFLPDYLISRADTSPGNLKLDTAGLPYFYDPDDVDGEPDEP